MDYLVLPRARELRGTLHVPPSKSATNRALLLASFSPTPVEVVQPLDSADTEALARCLASMGARIARQGGALSVSGPLAGPRERETELHAGDSGTAARFLAAVATAVPGRWLLRGSARLCERPIAELVAALRSASAAITYRDRDGFLPLAIEGGTLRSGTVGIDAQRSSQFVSALLLAGVLVEGGLEVGPAGPFPSAPYVSETLDALRAFGHEVEARDESFRVSRGSATPARYAVPGDYSSAIPLLCATAAVGGEVVLTGLAESCGVADAAALPVLAAMGVAVRFEDGALAARASGPPAPVAVRATDLPDSVPPLAALATRASGPSRFEGIGHLRWKESDRVAALADLLGAAGARCEVLDDALIVHPAEARPAAGPIRAGTRSDHRIAMAAAILAVSRGGMLIEDPGCVAKSYPAFFRDLSRLATPARAPASVATI